MVRSPVLVERWAEHLGVQVCDGEHEPHKHKLAEVVADLPVEEQQQEAVHGVGIVDAQEEVDARVQHVVAHRHQLGYLLCPTAADIFTLGRTSVCIRAERVQGKALHNLRASMESCQA